MDGKIKTTALTWVILLNAVELAVIIFHAWFLTYPGWPILIVQILLGGWGLVLWGTNSRLGYGRIFTTGIWFFKRDEDTQLMPRARSAFLVTYGAHILFSIAFSCLLAVYGVYEMLVFPVVKSCLILWANKQLFD